MQMILQRRSAFLQSTGLFVRTCRVSSAANVWADALSRQQLDVVYTEAAALGLHVVHLHVPPSLRETSWLLLPLA